MGDTKELPSGCLGYARNVLRLKKALHNQLLELTTTPSSGVMRNLSECAANSEQIMTTYDVRFGLQMLCVKRVALVTNMNNVGPSNNRFENGRKNPKFVDVP